MMGEDQITHLGREYYADSDSDRSRRRRRGRRLGREIATTCSAKQAPIVDAVGAQPGKEAVVVPAALAEPAAVER